jgi:hypothetical protein
MNERIKLLAGQAGFVMWADESWNPGDVIDWSCRYDDEFKRFAELIINESIKVMMANDYHGEWLGQKIKEHFGVDTIKDWYEGYPKET